MPGALVIRPSLGLCNRLGVVSSFAALARRSMCLHEQVSVAGVGGLNQVWRESGGPGFAGVFDVPSHPVVTYEGFRRCQDLLTPERRRRLLPGFDREFETELRQWRPVSTIRRRVAELAAAFDDDTVGVHIRRGDAVSHPRFGAQYRRSSAARAGEVIGVDVAGAIVSAAAKRYPDLDARVADVLALPFDDASFDVVVSNSTLDHFESRSTLRAAVGELARLIVPGGKLIITLDNRMNPIAALRTSRLFGPLHRLASSPTTWEPPTAPGASRGFCARAASTWRRPPRSCTVHPNWRPAWRCAEALRRAPTGRRRAGIFVACFACEAMGRWPTWNLTAHFVGAVAVRL
jgi:SAM-dependent methyltransferase